MPSNCFQTGDPGNFPSDTNCEAVKYASFTLYRDTVCSSNNAHNIKPWFTEEVRNLRKIKEQAQRKGNENEYGLARSHFNKANRANK